MRIWDPENSREGDYFFVGLFCGLLLVGLAVYARLKLGEWNAQVEETIRNLEGSKRDIPASRSLTPEIGNPFDQISEDMKTIISVVIVCSLICWGVNVLWDIWGAS